MPRIYLAIDNASQCIDTPDYTLAGEWFAKTISMYPITHASTLELRIQPMHIRDSTGAWVPDWNADTRHMDVFSIGGQNSRAGAIRKFIGLLEDQACRFEEMDGRSGACSICRGEGTVASDDPDDDGEECAACGGTGIAGGRR